METPKISDDDKFNNGLLAEILIRARGIDPLMKQKIIAALETAIRVYGREKVIADIYKVADDALGLPK